MVNVPSTLMIAAALLAALFGGGEARGQDRVIRNTARVQWDAGDAVRSADSNTVTSAVEAASPRAPTLSAFALVPEGPVRLAADGTICATNSRSGGSTFGVRSLSPASLGPLDSLVPGRPLVIAISEAVANGDPSRRDRLEVRITTSTGDSERLSLSETEADSGRFAGVVATAPAPPAAVPGDCLLSVPSGGVSELTVFGSDDALIGTISVPVRSSEVNVVFDADSGDPVAGARLTLVDARTKAPASVWEYDGVTRAASTTISAAGGGQRARSAGSDTPDTRDGSLPPGGFRFPIVDPGRYVLLVEPPPPYQGPSSATADQIARLGSFRIREGSYVLDFDVGEDGALDFDVPLDQPGTGLSLTKTVSSPVAEVGDRVLYTLTLGNPDTVRRTGEVHITDRLPVGLRLVPDSVRVGASTIRVTSADGGSATFALPALAPAEQRVVRYLAEVRPDARPGAALNRAQATDSRGLSSPVADAVVRISREAPTQRMTIVGRVTNGGCAAGGAEARGVGGIRIVLEDGSFAVTDPDGRYHLDGVRPGRHVVQMDEHSHPADTVAVDCARDTRSAGNASSRFVRGTGGSLARADFRLRPGDGGARLVPRTLVRPPVATDGFAAGGEGRDWLTGQAPGIGWLFPGSGDNPRARVVRVAIKHAPGQTVALSREGAAVPALNFDGTQRNAEDTVAVSVWRGIELTGRDTRFTAEVRAPDGRVIERLERTVHFADTPVRAEVLRDRSLLLADGVSRPVIAVRLIDGAGRPVHHGLTGPFAVPDPYLPAREAEALQARQLGGLERASATWRVEGDDGVAYLELMPTTASGSLTLTLPLTDGELRRDQRFDLWLDPGDRPWTVVGLAEGSLGRAAIDDHIVPLSDVRPLVDGRLAFYAKGRILGRWLLTASYDTDKVRDEQRFGGAIDPATYYTVYADGSERLFDAASLRKLYLKLERPQFAALFGDYQTGIDRPELTRYVRAFNGAQAQFDNGRVAATAFVADTAFHTRRSEIQGSGLSGPYSLGARALVPNGEQVAIEVRDRLRSNLVIERRELHRYLDYEIDYDTGVLRFREPIASRDLGLNPQFIVVDFEADGGARTVVNAGGRAGWTSADGRFAAAATAIHDRDETGATDIAGADARFRPSAATEVRAEFALSRGDRVETTGDAIRGDAVAWLVEAEHHGGTVDLLGYARQVGQGFGIGQQNRSERASRKVGLDGRYRLARDLSLTGSATTEDYLDSPARRIAVRAGLEMTRRSTTLRAGLAHIDDRAPATVSRRSTLVELGARQRVTDRLELDAKVELAPGGQDDSIDHPQRLTAGARWRAREWVDLIGAYELATGGSVDAGDARVGFELRPWSGARIATTANRRSVAELGTRSYAAFGLAQSLPLSDRLTVDASLDANATLGRFERDAILNPDQPVATGGFVGAREALSEDFAAATLGASWRGGRWSLTGRGELRRGSRTDRWGVTLGGIRQLGEGRSVGGRLIATAARGDGGADTRNVEASAAAAIRPAESAWSALDRFDYREDAVNDAVLGERGPVGGERLTVNGDARSRRLVNSLSVNWTPRGRSGGDRLERGELRLFLGARYNLQRYDDLDVFGFSLVAGADAEVSVGDRLSVGGQASARTGTGGRARAYAFGPRVTLSPAKNTAVTVGYNVAGFRDRDFEAARATRDGVFVTARMKFDAGGFGGLFK